MNRRGLLGWLVAAPAMVAQKIFVPPPVPKVGNDYMTTTGIIHLTALAEYASVLVYETTYVFSNQMTVLSRQSIEIPKGSGGWEMTLMPDTRVYTMQGWHMRFPEDNTAMRPGLHNPKWWKAEDIEWRVKGKWYGK